MQERGNIFRAYAYCARVLPGNGNYHENLWVLYRDPIIVYHHRRFWSSFVTVAIILQKENRETLKKLTRGSNTILMFQDEHYVNVLRSLPSFPSLNTRQVTSREKKRIRRRDKEKEQLSSARRKEEYCCERQTVRGYLWEIKFSIFPIFIVRASLADAKQRNRRSTRRRTDQIISKLPLENIRPATYWSMPRICPATATIRCGY